MLCLLAGRYEKASLTHHILHLVFITVVQAVKVAMSGQVRAAAADDEASITPLFQEGGSTAESHGATNDSFQKASYCMYGSHFLSAWGQRMWEFAIGLIMLDLGNGSLALVSTFGLVDGLAVFMAGPVVGDWIDRTARLKVGCTMYLLQNTAVALSASGALIALSIPKSGALFWLCVACTVSLGSASSVGALGATLSVEKEWTKALCQGNSARLANLNAGMRCIDLSCLILSPILVGFLMSFASIRVAVVVIVGWNLVAWMPEWLLLKLAWAVSASLRERRHAVAIENRKFSLLSGWGIYCRQPVLPAALSLALLYLTVLSFGLLATAYLKWRGMSEAELSLFRGLGAVAGISATLVFPRLHTSLGLVPSAALGIGWQLLSLTVAIAPALVGRFWGAAAVSASAVTHFLVGGIVLSRLGLWLFDLCVGQLLQERVSTNELGVVNGVQGSLASLLQSISYAAGLASPDPANFEWLMLGSWAVVLCAACIFCFWALNSSGKQNEVTAREQQVD